MTNEHTALITGASRGIGLGIATRLAEQGYALTIASRDPQRLEVVAAQLRAAGSPTVQCAAGDIADDGYLGDLVACHGERFGHLDALILNAGVGSAGCLDAFHPKRFDKQVAINLHAPFVLLQAALPLLRKTAAQSLPRGAKVVALASITGKYAEPELAAYGAAKAGLMSLCRSVNREESGNGLAATAVAPGYVDTDMTNYKHDTLSPEEMITIADVVEIVDACLRISSKAVIQEIVIERARGTKISA